MTGATTLNGINPKIHSDNKFVAAYNNDIKTPPDTMLPNKRIDKEINGDTALKILVGGQTSSFTYNPNPFFLAAVIWINEKVINDSVNVILKLDVGDSKQINPETLDTNI